MLGKDFEIAPEPSVSAEGTVYTLTGEITDWRAGNAAKRQSTRKKKCDACPLNLAASRVGIHASLGPAGARH